MKALVQEIRDRLMSTEDTVCLDRARLATEAYQMYEDSPVVLKRAKTFAHILRNMKLDVESNPIFAGNTSSRPRAWMLIPEHGFRNDTQVVIENEGLKGILDGQIPEDILEYWKDRSFGGSCGIGHLAVDLNRVVHTGLESLIAEAQEYDEDTDPDRRNYRQAMSIALQAVIDWAHRYAHAAEAAARTANDPILREAHLRVARACRHVPPRRTPPPAGLPWKPVRSARHKQTSCTCLSPSLSPLSPVSQSRFVATKCHLWHDIRMKFERLLEIAGDERVFETGLLLAGAVDPGDVRRGLSRWTQAG